MQNCAVSGFVAVSVAAAIIVPLTYGAHGQEKPSERNVATVNQTDINQSIDRADARIAVVKADLRLSPEQAQHWSVLASALHDIAVQRAKSWVASRDLQTGRAASKSPITLDSKERDATLKRGAREDNRRAGMSSRPSSSATTASVIFFFALSIVSIRPSRS